MDSYINHIHTQRQINSHKIKSVYTVQRICLKYLNNYKNLKKNNNHINKIIIFLENFIVNLKNKNMFT